MPYLRTLWLQVHATLELFALMVVVFELCMKLRWLGLHTFVRHKRTMVKVACPSPYSIFSPAPSIPSLPFKSPGARKCNLGSPPALCPSLTEPCSEVAVMVMLTAASVIRNLGRRARAR